MTITNGQSQVIDLNSYYKAEIIQQNKNSFRYQIKLSHKYLLGVSDIFGCFTFEDAQNWIKENLIDA